MAYSVLILDDDSDFNSLLTDIFEQADYIVTSLEDPIEAEEVFTHTDYDIVVTDHKMPEMSGAEFMRRIKKIKPEVPVIMVSGYLENDTIRELISEDVGGVFLKPLNIFSLLERTSELIAESKRSSAGANLPANGAGETADDEAGNLGFAFKSFPCMCATSTEFAERLYGLRNFKSALSLIGEPGSHYRAICEDIRGFYESATEVFVYLSSDTFDADTASFGIEDAFKQGAERVTCVLLDLHLMSEEQKALASKLPKCEGPFEWIEKPLRAIFCVSGDLDELFDQGMIDENLYILMGTAEVRVPPLRDCAADISVMAQQIAVEIAREKSLSAVPQFERAARDVFRTHNWSGNYEELRSTVRKVVDRASGNVITKDELSEGIHAHGAGPRAKLEVYLSNQKVEIVRAASVLLGTEKLKVAKFFDADVSAVDTVLR